MKRILIYCLLQCGIILFAGCITPSDSTDIQGPSIGFGVIDPQSIYPFQFISENQLLIFSNIYDGLVEFNEIFGITPDLAVSWTNPDAYTWRFNLRQNVTFHNGDPLTADDVKFSIDSIYLSYQSFIKATTIINPYTIEIVTTEPNPGLLQFLAMNFLIFPKNYHETNTTDWPIGTGAYQLSDYQENRSTTLTRYDNYWGTPPQIHMVKYIAIPDETDRVYALETGEVDVIDYNVDKNISTILKKPNLKIIEFPPLSTYIIGLDMRINNSAAYPNGQNPTANINVRKAIYHAINITPLIKGPFQGYAVPASQLLTPYIFGYNPAINRREYNLTKAREFLNQTPYAKGFNIELDCITIGYNYNLENCQLIKEQLSVIGINVSLNTMNTNDFYQKVLYEKNTSMWLVGWGTLSVDGGYVYNRFIMTQGDNGTGFYNSGHYSNPQVDNLGINASTEMNTRLRKEMLQQGYKIAMTDDVMLIPLFSQNLFMIANTSVNLSPRADLRIIIEDITITS